MGGKYGSASVVITVEDAPGGTARTITPYVRDISGVKIEQITQESNPFGTAFQGHTPVGVGMVPDITLHGFFDTTATVGPHVVFIATDDGPQDDGREFTFAPGDSKLFTVDTRLVSYEVLGQNNNLTEYEAVLRPTGTPVWS